MSRIRNVKGHITEVVGGDYKIYSASDIVESATDKFHETAGEGFFFGEPEDPPTSPDNPAKKPLELIVHFRRPDDYNGEFGFDWMRDDYKDICSNFDELGRDYESMKIYGKPYYVPWLAIFPDDHNDHKQQSEKGIRLKLEIESLNNSEDNIGTKIGLSTSSPFLLVNPTEIDSQKSSHIIEIRCTEKIADDKIFIEARDLASQNLVGKLNILRNDSIYRFTLFLIRLLDDPDKAENEEEKSAIERANECYLGHINDDWINSVADRVNNFGLNQALIKCDVVFKDIKIDSKDWIKNGYLTEDKRIIETSFREAIKPLCENNGVSVFLCGFLSKGFSSGAAWAGTKPTTLNYVICPQYIDSDGSSYAKRILLHEIGHVLGLGHTFGNDNTYKLQMLKTDNIMDYPVDPENQENLNPFDRITFSRRQWLKMQEEIVSYHGNKE